MAKLLLIDDVPEFLRETKAMLKGRFEVTTCRSPVRGIREAVALAPDVIITTLIMRELGGLEVVKRLRSRGVTAPIMMATRFGDDSTAREATRVGANDYVTYPFVPDELLSRLERMLARAGAERRPEPLKSLHDGICTADPEMLGLLELAHIAADTDSRILILGETGTGKELLARAIHRYSRRLKQPFVEINCAAIHENLLESELFGHEKGSFTGATEPRVGRFEQAGAGTLFLDEIGEISLGLQAKLLRVLQGGQFSRVGGNRTLVSKARVVAATNQDLRRRVEEGKFRADLFFRLNVVPLVLPPLRQRPGDVGLLADYFLERFKRRREGRQRFSEEARLALERHDWPGNIRELEHLVERASILVRKPVIEVADLPEHLRPGRARGSRMSGEGEMPTRYREAKAAFEVSYFRQVLAQAGGNYAAAAELAGMERSAFFRKAKRAAGARGALV